MNGKKFLELPIIVASAIGMFNVQHGEARAGGNPTLDVCLPSILVCTGMNSRGRTHTRCRRSSLYFTSQQARSSSSSCVCVVVVCSHFLPLVIEEQ